MGKQGSKKKIKAQTILVCGLTLTLLAGVIWALQTTAKDTTKLSQTAPTLLKDPTVRTELAQSVEDALIPDQSAVSTDEVNDAQTLAQAAVAQPQITPAFEAVLVAMHAHLFDGAQGQIELNQPAVLAAIHSAEVHGAPIVPVPPSFHVMIDPDALPNLKAAMSRLQAVMLLFAVLGIVLIAFGVVTSDHRGRSIMRVGRWMLVAGATAVTMFWAIPTLILRHMGSWGAIVGILLETGDHLIIPGVVLAIAGGGLILVGHVFDDSRRRRTLRSIPQAQRRRTIANNWEAPIV
ncbi:MAG TPA: hypothetical protein VIC35_10800 [Acidimicrobiia bacterium]|jgi:hypothetical protein